ncbi:hypothetical protein [Streptomyces sp. NRRL B-24572]|uniref:hypothetical protein n=1 Tax=Streptomyces sp. NRRL B-24572 TaxID=1962156 RepID=UPI000A3A0A46|nr:hypothetical protein [Streptomyces sp. NRRL B-24572]
MASATARRAAAVLRNRARDNRAAHQATQAVSTGAAAVSAHLIAGGLDPATAHRFSGAVTRKAKALGHTPTATGTKRKKLKGRVSKLVEFALWTRAQIAAVLAVYRPKDKQAAALFARLALAA